MSSTRVRQHVRASRSTIYRALTDPVAVAAWRVPDGMTTEVHEFTASEGGSFRVSLTYAEPTDTGKTTARIDTYHGHFERLVPDRKVVEIIEFDTTDPAYQGATTTTMTTTTTLTDHDGGTDVVIVHDALPPCVAPVDDAAGTRTALATLARLVEQRSASGSA